MLKTCEAVGSSSGPDSEAENGHEKLFETQPIRQALKSREQIRDKMTDAVEELRLLVNSWEQDSASSLLPEISESGEPENLGTHESIPPNPASISIFKEKTENDIYLSPDMQLNQVVHDLNGLISELEYEEGEQDRWLERMNLVFVAINEAHSQFESEHQSANAARKKHVTSEHEDINDDAHECDTTKIWRTMYNELKTFYRKDLKRELECCEFRITISSNDQTEAYWNSHHACQVPSEVGHSSQKLIAEGRAAEIEAACSAILIRCPTGTAEFSINIVAVHPSFPQMN